jgi:hypothetical protein
MESRILQLISALRSSGVRISLAESSEAFQAVDLMGILDKNVFRLSLRSTLIKDARDIPIFDQLFALFFSSDQPPQMSGNLTDKLTPDEAWMIAQAIRNAADSLQHKINRLIEGEPLSRADLEALAKMVGLDRVDDLRLQKWMTKRMLQALEFPEVRKAMRELLEKLSQMGLSREKLAQIRELVQQNMNGLQEQVSRFAGQRIAENLSARKPENMLDSLLQRPFDSLNEQEKHLIKQEVKRLAAVLRTRIALRQKHSKSGQLDSKATIRANLKYHGVPLEIRHRHRILKPTLVIFCDISTSMRFCSEMMLSLLFALQGQVSKTRAFAFIDHLEYISSEYSAKNADEAIENVLIKMPSGHYNTDLGSSLEDFNREFMNTMTGKTTFIVIGDGRNNYKNPRVDLFGMMARRSARTIWLNPEPSYLWHGDSDMHKYAPLCTDILQVGNLKDLTLAVDHLLAP